MAEKIFNHVLIIMFENQYRSYVMQNRYMSGLAAQGIDMANYFGVMHPSQTNYIASIAGELCNVTYDTPPPPLTQRTIVDLIEGSPYNLRWKAYMDSYIKQNTPWTPNLKPKDEFPYMIKHNPFSSFQNIVNNKSRWEKIDDEAGLFKDLLNGTFPEYSWFTPNMWNDGHYLDGTQTDPQERAPILVDQLAAWLKSFFTSLKFPGPNSHLPPKTLVVVTFDESDFENGYDINKKYTYDGPNQIYTVLLGDFIKPGVEYEGYNHYSLIKTIEKNFNLSSLQKNDTHCNWFQFLWDKKFAWGDPVQTNIEITGEFAAAEYCCVLYLVYQNDDNNVCFKTFDENYWSEERTTNLKCNGELALVNCNNQLVLILQIDSNTLQIYTYTNENGWNEFYKITSPENIEEITAVSFNDEQSFMLAYRTSEQNIYSLKYENNAWENEAVLIGFKSDGSITLAQLGAGLFLIYKVPGCTKMGVVTYNTKEFNVVELTNSTYSGPYDNTTINKWSPSSFPVADFLSAPNPVTPGEKEPETKVYRANGKLVAGTLDGVIHLVHSGKSNPQLLTETFSISGVMTPELKVSYNSKKETTTSNGYGTIAEAGWSKQIPINGSFNNPPSTLALAKLNNSIFLIFRQGESNKLSYCKGEYI